MNAMDRFEGMLAHPAPGLVFAEHERAGAPERAVPTPHVAEGPASRKALAKLESLTGDSRLADLIEFYRRHDGVGLCQLHDSFNKRTVPALQFLPIKQWEAASAHWRPGGDMASFMEDCPLYDAGTWRVFASMPSEGMVLVIFFDGEYEGQQQAGMIYTLGLDGYFGFEEVVAQSFGELLDECVGDLAGLFNRLGFTWYVEGNDGVYGDPIEAYMPDIRQHRAFRG